MASSWPHGRTWPNLAWPKVIVVGNGQVGKTSMLLPQPVVAFPFQGIAFGVQNSRPCPFTFTKFGDDRITRFAKGIFTNEYKKTIGQGPSCLWHDGCGIIAFISQVHWMLLPDSRMDPKIG